MQKIAQVRDFLCIYTRACMLESPAERDARRSVSLSRSDYTLRRHHPEGDGRLAVEAHGHGVAGGQYMAGQETTPHNLNIQPTLTDRPGPPLRIIVHSDLVLRPHQPSFFNRGTPR